MTPKYSLMGPFRGHMSIKSSPFSPGSSCKLSSQYIIQDNMATHYRKLFSAKAAVDSSAPKSLNMSIKYQDQQKREQLIKAVEKVKKEMAHVFSGPASHSRCISAENHKGLLPIGRTTSLEKRGQHSPKYLKQIHLSDESPDSRNAEKMTPNTVQWCFPQTPSNGRSRVLRSVFPLIQPHLPLQSYRKTKMFLTPQKKSLGGDLLDTHAQCFTDTKQPFTPKVLKTARSSFLSKYRYYNHPAGKKSLSFNKPSHKRPRKIFRSMEDEYLRSAVDCHILHPVKEHCLDSVSVQSLLHAKEEELKYLQFLQNLTNDILIQGCYNKALGDEFHWHTGNRRCDLDEVSKKYIYFLKHAATSN